jgi:hypothetical protein
MVVRLRDSSSSSARADHVEPGADAIDSHVIRTHSMRTRPTHAEALA